MAISNTSILVKRSTSTGRPSSLLAGELAYSYASNTIFIGSPTGNGVVNVGGQFYTAQVDAATSSNTASTLVKRDANGNFAGRLTGTASTADVLTNARNFSISGGDITASAVGFDGSAAVALSASLNSIPGLTAGTYGSTTAIPVVTVAANGRVTGISTSAISTSFNISDGTTSNTINGGATFYHLGTKGITTAVTANTVTFGTDNTIVRSNTSGGTQTINTNLTVSQDLSVTGNLTVLGNTVSLAVQTIDVYDSLIYLANNNFTSDLVDIGFIGHYYNANTGNSHAGFIRDATDKEFYIFGRYDPEISGNNNIDTSNSTFQKANVNANYFKGNVIATTISAGSLSLTSALPIASGGTNNTSFTNNQITYFNGSSIASLANVGTAGTYGSASYHPVITTDGFGRVSAVTNTAIAIDTSAVISGTLPLIRGGTNSASYAQNGILYYNGSSFLTSANVTAYTTQGGASYVPSITTNALGQVTAIANTQIQIDAATNIVSGTLPLTRGGTGATSFTNGQVVIGNGTTSLISLANSTYTLTGALQANNTITSLTVDAYGRVTAATGAAISGLTVAQGGTGFATATTNGIVYGNGTAAMGVTAVAGGGSDQTWSNQILTVTNAGVPVWSSAMDGGSF